MSQKQKLPDTARSSAVAHSGLRPRPQFEQIVDYFANGQERVNFPDREAKFLRNHPLMTQLDFFDTNEEQKRAWDEQQRKKEAKEIATQSGTSQAMEGVKTTNQEISALVSPYEGGRRPDGEVNPMGVGRQSARNQFDADIAYKRRNTNVYVEHDDEIKQFRINRENKSDLTTQTVRFHFDSGPWILTQRGRGQPWAYAPEAGEDANRR